MQNEIARDANQASPQLKTLLSLVVNAKGDVRVVIAQLVTRQVALAGNFRGKEQEIIAEMMEEFAQGSDSDSAESSESREKDTPKLRLARA